MKKILTSLAAIGALFTASTAFAEPTHDTDTYYFLGGNQDYLGLAADDVETTGTHKTVWLFVFFQTPLTQNGTDIEGVWALTEFDCSNDSYRVVRQQLMTPDGDTDAEGQSDWRPITANTPGGRAEALVCKGDASQVEKLTVEDAAKLMVAFRNVE